VGENIWLASALWIGLALAAGAEAQTHRHIAVGVRDNVLPPMPTEAPSGTSAAASSSGITFSRRLRSLSLVRRQSSV
jgi:hypothetical protein